MCESVPKFDLTLFGQGKEWLRVNFTFDATGPAQSPVNLWFEAGGSRRKHLPLVQIGDLPGTHEKLLRIDEACFTSSEQFGSSCTGKGEHCAHCGDQEVCGATAECGAYDLTQTWLQVAAEFCSGSGNQSGTVALHKVELVEPQCAM
jgi:hypothetical protein